MNNAGLAQTFQRAIERHAPHFVYGFCLYSDDNVRFVEAIVATRQTLKQSNSYYDTGGWAHDHAGIKTLLPVHDELTQVWSDFDNGPGLQFDEDDERLWNLVNSFEDLLIETMIVAIARVIHSGGFGPPNELSRRFFTFDLLDSPRRRLSHEWVRRLNLDSVVDAYERGEAPPI